VSLTEVSAQVCVNHEFTEQYTCMDEWMTTAEVLPQKRQGMPSACTFMNA
jgi:hypothetical protein